MYLFEMHLNKKTCLDSSTVYPASSESCGRCIIQRVNTACFPTFSLVFGIGANYSFNNTCCDRNNTRCSRIVHHSAGPDTSKLIFCLDREKYSKQLTEWNVLNKANTFGCITYSQLQFKCNCLQLYFMLTYSMS